MTWGAFIVAMRNGVTARSGAGAMGAQRRAALSSSPSSSSSSTGSSRAMSTKADDPEALSQGAKNTNSIMYYMYDEDYDPFWAFTFP
eukprot:CAMPEP_0197438210 /NCGR_PEP_ID=MMETSP1175-20131217/5269_1 /TAXON_ID=1003142 /ORGANISM="Triceratium dubium, Strain CCMP147" /LENGTH=86 /DNA_ID=CAMNT_0042967893 /DNA_START=156 /DNA_END=416 /DNA_ORIENTATION=-